MVANVNKKVTAAGEISFLADCPSSIAVDDLVYITGPHVGGIAQVDLVDVTDVSSMPAIGIVTQKITSTRCNVVSVGQVTTATSLTAGEKYFVGSDGRPSLVIPNPAPGGISFSQAIGVASDTNLLIFNPDLMLVILDG